jgi:two-component system, OmpR family, alkaline phosphatase synthesis response regulator PhoP
MEPISDPTAASVDGRRPKILVVNDSPDFLAFMREFLTMEGGYEVATLDQSEGVIEQVSSTPPDLLIIDIVFRGAYTGFEIADRLASAAETAGIPVLFCTALLEREIPDHVRELLIQRGNRVLHKPFDIDDLLTHLQEMMPRLQPS